MAEAGKNQAERPELRAAAPHQGGPLGSSGAAPGEQAAPPAVPPTDSTPDEPADPAAVQSIDDQQVSDYFKASPGTTAAAAPGKDQTAGEKAAADSAAKTPDDTAKSPDPKPAETKAPDVPAKHDEPKITTSRGAKSGRGRRFRPLHTTGRAARGTVAWAKGPSGRVVLPGFLVAALVVAAGTSGAYLVPKALEAAPTPSATPQFGAASVPPAVWGSPGGTLPGAGSLPPSYPVPGGVAASGLPGATQPTVTNVRPADSLASWASQIGTKVGIPVVAVQAYGYAELVTAQTTPSCHLSWTTLAAIGKVESSHGSYNGAVLGADGVAQPTIFGLPLDGQGGRQLIADTDRGALDQDTTYDRAIGPMQFIPATWKESAIDADRDGVSNPNDIDDAALTAAAYLCKGGHDLSRADSWWDAILSYNAVRPYAEKVFNTADDYGRRSRA